METSFKNQMACDKETTFRYFKLTFFNTQQNQNWIQLAEFNFFNDNMDKFSWKSLKLISHNMPYDAKHEHLTSLFDGNLNTKWCYGGVDQSNIWYGICDLGESNKIDVAQYHKFCWYNANDTNSYRNRRVFKMKIEFSNDLKTWTAMADVDNLDTTSENYALAYVGELQH